MAALAVGVGAFLSAILLMRCILDKDDVDRSRTKARWVDAVAWPLGVTAATLLRAFQVC